MIIFPSVVCHVGSICRCIDIEKVDKSSLQGDKVEEKPIHL